MKPNNDRLKAILHDVKVVYKSKFLLVHEKNSLNLPRLEATAEKLEAVFLHFENPGLWMRSIAFSEEKILDFMLRIDTCDPEHADQFLLHSDQFIDYLENEILRFVTPPSGIIPDRFNQGVIEALRGAHQSISGRKVFFRNRNIDLDRSPEFLLLEADHLPKVTAYQQLLSQNVISATESDVMLFRRFEPAIKQAVELKVFLGIYGLLTLAIQKKLPPEEISVPD